MKTKDLLGFAVGFVFLAVALKESLKSEGSQERERQETQDKFAEAGFRVNEGTDGQGNQIVRLRGSWEDLQNLVNPGHSDNKPPLPDDLEIDSLPSYHCGCPHCGKMSMYGESQWRYQELSRTRGPRDNTTTFLTLCKECNGFMKSTVDHDD